GRSDPPRVGAGGGRVSAGASGRGARPSRETLAMLALLLAFVLVLARLFSPAGGLRGRYVAIGQGGVEALVTERVDHGIDFSVPQRLDAAYVFHWNQRVLGDFPRDSMPPYLVHWSGLLQVPAAGSYGFALDAQGEGRLSIDGAPLEM